MESKISLLIKDLPDRLRSGGVCLSSDVTRVCHKCHMMALFLLRAADILRCVMQ